MNCKGEKVEVVISLRTCIALGLLLADTFREGAVFRRAGVEDNFVDVVIAEASDCCKQADIFLDVLNGVHDDE